MKFQRICVDIPEANKCKPGLNSWTEKIHIKAYNYYSNRVHTYHL